jgi:hypothetical protein
MPNLPWWICRCPIHLIRLSLLKKSKKRYHYGENSEDALINSFFSKKKHGTYLDVGCYHPIRGSLTYNLYKKGWSGINIDLSKETIDLFNICRPNDLNLNIGISHKNSNSKYFRHFAVKPVQPPW